MAPDRVRAFAGRRHDAASCDAMALSSTLNDLFQLRCLGHHRSCGKLLGEKGADYDPCRFGGARCLVDTAMDRQDGLWSIGRLGPAKSAGVTGTKDGYVRGNLMAGFSHLRHTKQSPWAPAFTNFVRKIKRAK